MDESKDTYPNSKLKSRNHSADGRIEYHNADGRIEYHNADGRIEYHKSDGRIEYFSADVCIEEYRNADVRINKYNEAWFDVNVDDQDNSLDDQDKLYYDNQSPGLTGDVDVVSNQEKNEDNDSYELSCEREIVHELKEMNHHRDDNDLTLKVIKMDLEEIENCLNNIMDDFLMEYKEMEHELDSTRKNPVMGENYSQLLPGYLICECQFSCGWRQLIVVCLRNLMIFFFGYQSSARPPERITREAVSSLECV